MHAFACMFLIKGLNRWMYFFIVGMELTEPESEDFSEGRPREDFLFDLPNLKFKKADHPRDYLRGGDIERMLGA